MEVKSWVDLGILVVGSILSGMLALLWYDIRSIRGGLKNYVKCSDCRDMRGVCGSMRQAMSDLVDAHGDSLVTMQELLRNSTECLARLDERVKALKEQLERVIDGMSKLEHHTLS